jgi:hypothetical protein
MGLVVVGWGCTDPHSSEGVTVLPHSRRSAEKVQRLSSVALSTLHQRGLYCVRNRGPSPRHPAPAYGARPLHPPPAPPPAGRYPHCTREGYTASATGGPHLGTQRQHMAHGRCIPRQRHRQQVAAAARLPPLGRRGGHVRAQLQQLAQALRVPAGRCTRVHHPGELLTSPSSWRHPASS